MKRVSEVFCDFDEGITIRNAIVENAIIRKKSKTLELVISSDEYIEVNEIETLNDFIKDRFVLKDSKITINYTKEVEKKPIEEEIHNIMVAL